MNEFNKEKFYSDILYAFDVIKRNHPNLYSNISESELDSLILGYINDKSIDNFDKSLYYLNKIFKRIGDSHTFLSNYYNPLKLNFKIINGKCYVSESSERKELIGYELTHINDIEISIILKELRNIIIPRTEEGILGHLESDLSNKAIISILPIINSSTSYKYTLKRDNKTYEYIEELDNVDFTAFKRKKNYEYYIKDGIVVINYRICKEMENYSFDDMVKEIENINADGYIVDLRGNTGGNSEIIKPLIIFLKDKNVVTIVDNHVFSSGIFAALNLKKIGSLIVGTSLSEKLNGFGDIKMIELPNYNLDVSYSTKYFGFKDNHVFSLFGKKEYDDFFKDKNNLKYLDPIYIKPDIYSETIYEDVVSNNDSVLENAIDVLFEKINTKKL